MRRAMPAMSRLSETRRRRWPLCALGLGLLACIGSAHAQLTPARTYYAAGAQMAMEVRLGTAPAAGESTLESPASSERAEVVLLSPAKGDTIARASVVEGAIDLAALFPTIWKDRRPEVLYAQARVGGKGIGPPVVLQPMTTPARAAAADPRGFSVRFTQPSPAYYAGIRAYVDRHVVLETSAGEIEIRLRPDAAPNTVWNFRQLVEGGFYTDNAFHKVVAGPTPAEGFVIQAGDPLGNDKGGPGYCIDLEKSDLKHEFGVVSMARQSQPDTGGSQFFICLSRERTAALDGAYAAFGQVVRGADAIRAIARTPVDAEDRPRTAQVIKRARLVDAPPFGEGPKPVSEETGAGR